MAYSRPCAIKIRHSLRCAAITFCFPDRAPSRQEFREKLGLHFLNKGKIAQAPQPTSDDEVASVRRAPM
jgi:hypothetical protein